MRANLSILGLYNHDSTVMDGLISALPKNPDTGADLLDSSVLVNNILLECAELEVCYPEPETMKQAISIWAEIRTGSWQRIALALDAEYNPIHNYDRHEDISRTFTPGAGYTTTVKDPGYTDTMVEPGYTDAMTHEVTGYNSNNLVAQSKDTDVRTYQTNGSLQHVHNTDGSQTYTPDGESDTDSVTNHMYGNIGVTTAAQMLEGELEIRRNDIYNIITNEFRRRFCLLVY